MIHLFVVAGIPFAYARYIDARIRKKIASDVGKLVTVPLPKGMMTPAYGQAYRAKLLRECSRWVEAKDLDDSFSISLLYAQGEDKHVQRLIDDFFPFALACEFQPLQIVQKPNLMQREINALVSRLVPLCAKLRTQTKIIHDHMTSRVRHTPLLLPPRNFGNQELFDILRELQSAAPHRHPLENLIKVVIGKFNKAVDRQLVSNERHYMNAEGLVFVAPRYDQFHGFARKNGHPLSCYLRGRARLGGSYNPKFHYDCIPSKGKLKEAYGSCHLQAVSVCSDKHVNIAPNDYVRGRETQETGL